MSEVQPQEQFEVLHRSTCKDLQLERAALETYAAAEPASPLVQELTDTVTKILALVSPEGALNAEAIFKNAIEAMGLVEAKHFVLSNLLEGLKRGEDEKILLSRFKMLGLRGATPPQTPAQQETVHSDADIPTEVTKGLGLLKRCGLALAQITVNALRTIPKFVEIEPSISLVGPLPVLALNLKGKGMSIHELFEALRAPGRFYRGA